VKLQDQPFQVLSLLLGAAGGGSDSRRTSAETKAASTFAEFDDGLNTAIKKQRLALNDAEDNRHFSDTVPRRGIVSSHRSRFR
jgi:hypothetical protein